MFKSSPTNQERNKGIMIFLLNFMFYPYVLGHFDNRDYACEFSIIKKSRTAFRLIGQNNWQIHDLESAFDHQLTVVSTKNHHGQNLNIKTFKEIFEKEQFNCPIRAHIVEAIYSF